MTKPMLLTFQAGIEEINNHVSKRIEVFTFNNPVIGTMLQNSIK
jgi:hypothetical protein